MMTHVLQGGGGQNVIHDACRVGKIYPKDGPVDAHCDHRKDHGDERTEHEESSAFCNCGHETDEGERTCDWVQNETSREVVHVHCSRRAVHRLDSIKALDNTQHVVPNTATRALITAMLTTEDVGTLFNDVGRERSKRRKLTARIG